MTPDGELLRRYTEAASEEAFGELVRRHIHLVYSAALRQVNGDAHLAQDIAQIVFADLARKAASLASRPALGGWLYTSTHYAAAKAVRTEQRRHAREQEAQAMQELVLDPGTNPDWETLRPVLDTAMHDLDEAGREVILMRYFENRPHADIGEQIGLSENAARMRVERALEKLRTALSRRGVTTTVALSTALAANAVTVAPPGLATAITTASFLAGTTIASAGTATVTKGIIMTTLQKTLVGTALAAAIGTGIHEARQNSKLREQVRALAQQQTQQTEELQRERDEAVAKLAALRDEYGPAKSDSVELLKLRAEVARLRTSQQPTAKPRTTTPGTAGVPIATNAPPTASELPKDSWADVGFATPQSALQTRGWAVLNGNRERFKESVVITDGARKLMEEMLEKMIAAAPPAERKRASQEILNNGYGFEEALLFPMVAENQTKGYTGYQILSQQSPSADEMLLEVATGMTAAPSKKEILKFRRVGTDWKVVIDEDFIKAQH